MPTVNNLMSGKTSTPLPSQQPPANPGNALVAGNLHTNAQQALADPTKGVGDIATRPVGAYIGNAHPRSNNWQALQQAGVAEGDFYLDGGGEQTRKCMPLKYWLYAVSAFGTKIDPQGNIIKATDDANIVGNQQALKSAGFDEHYVTVVLVDLGDKIVPAKADFRTTKSNCAKMAIDAIRKSMEPGWPQSSDNAMVAAQFPHPFGRMYFTATTSKGTVRGGPNAGLPYFAARVHSMPTPVGELERLAKWLATPEAVESINQTWQNYEMRCEQIRRSITG